MATTVLIGDGRRITLQDLDCICRGDCKLEVPIPSSYEISVKLNNVFFSKYSNNDSTPLLSPCGTLAAVATLAFTICQNRMSTSENLNLQTSMALVELINDCKSNSYLLQLPSSPQMFFSSLASILESFVEPSSVFDHFKSMESSILTTIQGRILPLAVTSLSSARLLNLTKTNIIDALASLSVERTCTDPTIHFSETNFDIMRPHLGMKTVASLLRALTQGSKFATKNPMKKSQEFNSSQINAVQTIPQYHGPASEAVLTSSKILDLEYNCFEVWRNGKLVEMDNSVLDLTCRTMIDSCRILISGCRARFGSIGTETLNDKGVDGLDLWSMSQSLEVLVSTLENCLMDEAQFNNSFMKDQIQAANDAAIKRAEEKAAAAAKFAAAAKKKGAKDEFDGMSEVKKAKILKERAKKEAKKAAKMKNKKSAESTATVSIFGPGSMTILSTLQKFDFVLSPKNMSELDEKITSVKSGGVQRKPKIAKGTRDYLPEEMMIRDEAFQIIRRVFKSHGAVEIDTPVFELKDTLTGKYGEDSKLIYDLADQGGESLALRYDLTVPFARYLALNSLGNIKRYHIGKVYRRDQPVISRGRYREFYQCDFDIAGTYGRMVPDSECLCVASEILSSLPIGDFRIKLNHRKLLDAILEICGVPANKFRTICSAVDKLDKSPWSEVKDEMVETKGLSNDVADRIGHFVVQKGNPWDLYQELTEGNAFGDHNGAKEALEDLRILFQYLEAMDKLKYFSFDLSLARGLDYYTGVIYEAISMNGNTQVGSIGGGGRYDNLVSMFQDAGKETPCVGVSIGIERVFTLMEERLRREQGTIKRPNVKVLVAQAGENMMLERMKISNILWKSNISAEFNQQENPKLKFEIANALDREIPFMVVVGEDEAKENKCKVKHLQARTEETVDLSCLVSTLRNKGVVPIGCEFASEYLAKEQKDTIPLHRNEDINLSIAFLENAKHFKANKDAIKAEQMNLLQTLRSIQVALLSDSNKGESNASKKEINDTMKQNEKMKLERKKQRYRIEHLVTNMKETLSKLEK